MIGERRLDEHLGEGQSVGRQIVISERARLIGVVEENHRPLTFDESCRSERYPG